MHRRSKKFCGSIIVCTIQHTTDTVNYGNFAHISNNKNVMFPGINNNLQYLEKICMENNEILCMHDQSPTNFATISP
jgi:hypothetical protein